MAQKTKTLDINIVEEGNNFNTFFKKLTGESKDYDFEGLSALRRILSNEKAKILYVIKSKKPGSIYQLAKLLGRDFKSVSDDIKLLERFGFIDMTSEKTGKRERLRPSVIIDSSNIHIKI